MPDNDFPGRDSLKERNLAITVDDEQQAEQIKKKLEDSGSNVEITLDSEEDRRAALRSEMADELGAVVAGPGNVGPQTKGQNKGSTKWGFIGLIVGGGLMFLVGLMAWPTSQGLMWTTIIGAVAGGTAGFTLGGSFGPRVHDESGDVAKRPVIGVHGDASQIEAARAAIAGNKVNRVDQVNSAGTPIGGASKDTRPLKGDTPT